MCPRKSWVRRKWSEPIRLRVISSPCACALRRRENGCARRFARSGPSMHRYREHLAESQRDRIEVCQQALIFGGRKGGKQSIDDRRARSATLTIRLSWFVLVLRESRQTAHEEAKIQVRCRRGNSFWLRAITGACLKRMAELRHAVKPTVNSSGLMYSNAQSISAAKGTIADTSGDGFLILP